jgi:hypothetical protein
MYPKTTSPWYDVCCGHLTCDFFAVSRRASLKLHITFQDRFYLLALERNRYHGKAMTSELRSDLRNEKCNSLIESGEFERSELDRPLCGLSSLREVRASRGEDCIWCKTETGCKANVISCDGCLDREPFTILQPKDFDDGEFVTICKLCFENHIKETPGAKEALARSVFG